MENISKNFNKKKKIVIITGGMGFLGKEYVVTLAQNGFLPIILDIKRKNEIDKFVKSINKKYQINTSGFQVDITSEKKVSSVSKKILKKYKKIDILINNAANNPVFKKKFKDSNRLEKFELKKWNLDLNVGLTGAFICSKYFGDIISKNKNGGSIINISSDLGLLSPDHRIYNKNSKYFKKVKPISYSVVKSGIIGLSRYLATYWLGKVRSNVLCLGGVKDNQDKNFLSSINKLIPLGRMANKEDYQGIIKYLCSDESSYLNGAIIPLDGGRSSW